MGDRMKKRRIMMLVMLMLLIKIEPVSAMKVVNCGGLNEVPYVPLRFVGRVINIIKVVTPIVLIIMGMVDMARATTANSEKDMDASRKRFMKRIVYAVMVFFVISLVQLLFSILQTSVFKNENNLLGCMTCVLGGECDTKDLDITSSNSDGSNKSNNTSESSSSSKSGKKVTSIKITNKKTEIKEGDSYTLKVDVKPTSAENKKLNYKSSKTGVATISSTGKIKGKKEGTTTITVQSASNKSKKQTFKLTVIDPLDAKRKEVVKYAKKFKGNKYVYGGTSLTNGTDCSGFTMSVYKHFGYNLPRTSGSQSSYGKKVSSLSDAKPGDLLFYSKNSTVNHVALYMGNNKVIHASNPSTGITTSLANYRTITKIRRVIY